MTPAHIIARKRDGQTLSPEEIAEFIRGFTSGAVADYQMSALAMAIYIRGTSAAETTALTAAMLDSGTRLEWPGGHPPIVDKHSTGGIGDKTSLILAPLLACCDLWVPMISGRGLGPTGGTLDKLESIPGFRTDLARGEIRRITQRVGCVITGATEGIAPADKKLYALRDVTATVASIPLITSSIMSKKLSENLDALVLDVKFGSGAFMKTLDAARELAAALVAVGTQMNVGTTALLTDMNQPLGRMIGNSVEVNEAIAALEGGGPSDLRELTLSLGAELLVATGRAECTKSAVAILADHLDSGRAHEKFRDMVLAQGGDPDSPRPVAPKSAVTAACSGFVAAVDAEQFGNAVIELGGGRRLKTDPIDPSVGLETLVRIGDQVEAGQPLLHVFSKNKDEVTAALSARLTAAIEISYEPPPALPLIAATR